jgi:hypothetical protein
MEQQTITADFTDEASVESVIGRLEVLGVPPEDIQKILSSGCVTRLTVRVEDRLVPKAQAIIYG